MRPLKFTLEDQVVRDGFTDDTYWNGFINVWVTRELHEELNLYLGLSDDEVSTIQADDTGYIPYGGGAVICTEVHPSPDERLELKITIHDHKVWCPWYGVDLDNDEQCDEMGDTPCLCEYLEGG